MRQLQAEIKLIDKNCIRPVEHPLQVVKKPFTDIEAGDPSMLDPQLRMTGRTRTDRMFDLQGVVLLIFWKQRVVFLANPKTGSTSLEMALEPLAEIAFQRPRR